MSHPHACPTARRRLLRPALFAASLTLGLASVAVTAQAQTGVANPPTAPAAVPTTPPGPSAAPAAPDAGGVGGVTVEGARRDPLRFMDPKKRAAFDAEAAKQDAARHYRTSMPPLAADSKGISDPNDMSKDYPGLNSLVPPK